MNYSVFSILFQLFFFFFDYFFGPERFTLIM